MILDTRMDTRKVNTMEKKVMNIDHCQIDRRVMNIKMDIGMAIQMDIMGEKVRNKEFQSVLLLL